MVFFGAVVVQAVLLIEEGLSIVEFEQVQNQRQFVFMEETDGVED